MTLFTKQLPGLFNGVSQQPATLRLPSQAEEVINCFQSVVDGTSKRNPTEHVASLPSSVDTSAKIHLLNRDTNTRFIVAITDGDLKVFDLQGNEIDVMFPHGKTYLENAEPRSGFRCVSVADFTFIVNKSVKVEMDEPGADYSPQPTTYWWLNRSLDSDSAYVAQQKQYQTNPSYIAYRGAGRSIDYIWENAPSRADGDVWKILSSADNKFSTFYVRQTGGEAVECVAPDPASPGIRNLLDANTMPHALVLLEDGTFAFGPFSWAPRHAGDEVTNPNPSFVGRTINDVFFYKNRLWFLSDENAIGSRVGDYGTFYRLTVTDTLADERIDTTPSTNKVSVLNHAVPFDRGIMAFSDQTQFYLGNSNGTTTGASMSADVTTEYTCSKEVPPVSIGSDVYFPSGWGDYTTAWEYFVRDDAVANDAANITAHVPKYIPKGLLKLIASTNHDVLFGLSALYPNRLYQYRFYWQGDTKAQSAWSHWEFDSAATILDGDVLDAYLYLVVRRGTEVSIERLALQPGAKPGGMSFQVHLDRRVGLSGVYLPLEDRTEFTLPYNYDSSLLRLVKGPAFTTAVGGLIDPTLYEFTESNKVKVLGNYSSWTVYAGHKYTMKYTFSEQFVVDSNGAAVNTGRLQIRSYTVYFVDTAYFRTVVDPYGDLSQLEEVDVVPSKLADFTGKTLGSTSLVIGQPSFAKGAYTFQVYAPSTSAKVSITNDSHLGCTLQKAEVEMFYFNRAQVR